MLFHIWVYSHGLLMRAPEAPEKQNADPPWLPKQNAELKSRKPTFASPYLSGQLCSATSYAREFLGFWPWSRACRRHRLFSSRPCGKSPGGKREILKDQLFLDSSAAAKQRLLSVRLFLRKGEKRLPVVFENVFKNVALRENGPDLEGPG